MKTHHGVEATPRELLDRWVARGLLTRDQAESIRAEEGWDAAASIPAAAPPVRRASLISEALGYLGGILIVVAASLIGTWYWSDIPTWARLGIPIMAAAILLGGGWARSQVAGGRHIVTMPWSMLGHTAVSQKSLTCNRPVQRAPRRGNPVRRKQESGLLSPRGHAPFSPRMGRRVGDEGVSSKGRG